MHNSGFSLAFLGPLTDAIYQPSMRAAQAGDLPIDGGPVYQHRISGITATHTTYHLRRIGHETHKD
jgi:hypothetical protein